MASRACNKFNQGSLKVRQYREQPIQLEKHLPPPREVPQRSLGQRESWSWVEGGCSPWPETSSRETTNSGLFPKKNIVMSKWSRPSLRLTTYRREKRPDLPADAAAFSVSESAWDKGWLIATMQDGVMQSDQDPTMFVVQSETANFRHVDTCTFYCNCPRPGFCSHLIATSLFTQRPLLPSLIANLFRDRYNRLQELAKPRTNAAVRGKVAAKRIDQNSLSKSAEVEISKLMSEGKFSLDEIYTELLTILAGFILRERDYNYADSVQIESSVVGGGMVSDKDAFDVVDVSSSSSSASSSDGEDAGGAEEIVDEMEMKELLQRGDWKVEELVKLLESPGQRRSLASLLAEKRDKLAATEETAKHESVYVTPKLDAMIKSLIVSGLMNEEQLVTVVADTTSQLVSISDSSAALSAIMQSSPTSVDPILYIPPFTGVAQQRFQDVLATDGNNLTLFDHRRDLGWNITKPRDRIDCLGGGSFKKMTSRSSTDLRARLQSPETNAESFLSLIATDLLVNSTDLQESSDMACHAILQRTDSDIHSMASLLADIICYAADASAQLARLVARLLDFHMLTQHVPLPSLLAAILKRLPHDARSHTVLQSCVLRTLPWPTDVPLHVDKAGDAPMPSPQASRRASLVMPLPMPPSERVRAPHTSVLESEAQKIISDIRREQFLIGSKGQEVQKARLSRAIGRIAEDLYAGDAHVLWELLQNVDDCDFAEGEASSVTLVANEEGFCVLSNELGFTEAHVRAISDIACSSKQNDPIRTGKFGVGFKSVFMVTDTPMIFSNAFSIGFASVEALPNVDADGVAFVCPYWISASRESILPPSILALMESYNYGSVIWLPRSPQARKDRKMGHLRESLRQMESETMLFLRRLTHLRSITNDVQFVISKETEEVGQSKFAVTLKRHSSTSAHVAVDEFVVRESRATFTHPDTDAALVIFAQVAISASAKKIPGRLYCTLPVGFTGLPFHVNGNFALSVSRELVMASDPANIACRDMLVGLLCDSFQVSGAQGFLSLLQTLPSPENCDPFFRPLVHQLSANLTMLTNLPDRNGTHRNISELRYMDASCFKDDLPLAECRKVVVAAMSYSSQCYLLDESLEEQLCGCTTTMAAAAQVGLKLLSATDLKIKIGKLMADRIFWLLCLVAAMMKNGCELFEWLRYQKLGLLNKESTREIMALSAVKQPVFVVGERGSVSSVADFCESGQLVPGWTLMVKEVQKELEGKACGAILDLLKREIGKRLNLILVDDEMTEREVCKAAAMNLAGSLEMSIEALINTSNAILKTHPDLMMRYRTRWVVYSPLRDRSKIVRELPDRLRWIPNQIDASAFTEERLDGRYAINSRSIDLFDIQPVWYQAPLPNADSFRSDQASVLASLVPHFGPHAALLLLLDRIYCLPSDDSINKSVIDLLRCVSPFISSARIGLQIVAPFLRQAFFLRDENQFRNLSSLSIRPEIAHLCSFPPGLVELVQECPNITDMFELGPGDSAADVLAVMKRLPADEAGWLAWCELCDILADLSAKNCDIPSADNNSMKLLVKDLAGNTRRRSPDCIALSLGEYDYLAEYLPAGVVPSGLSAKACKLYTSMFDVCPIVDVPCARTIVALCERACEVIRKKKVHRKEGSGGAFAMNECDAYVEPRHRLDMLGALLLLNGLIADDDLWRAEIRGNNLRCVRVTTIHEDNEKATLDIYVTLNDGDKYPIADADDADTKKCLTRLSDLEGVVGTLPPAVDHPSWLYNAYTHLLMQSGFKAWQRVCSVKFVPHLRADASPVESQALKTLLLDGILEPIQRKLREGSVICSEGIANADIIHKRMQSFRVSYLIAREALYCSLTLQLPSKTCRGQCKYGKAILEREGQEQCSLIVCLPRPYDNDTPLSQLDFSSGVFQELSRILHPDWRTSGSLTLALKQAFLLMQDLVSSGKATTRAEAIKLAATKLDEIHGEDVVGQDQRWSHNIARRGGSLAAATEEPKLRPDEVILGGFRGEKVPFIPIDLSGPELTASDLAKQKTGAKGELLVYKQILNALKDEIAAGRCTVTWLNEVNETGLPYDLLVTRKRQPENEEHFIEVKSTASSDKQTFEISYNEWRFAQQTGDAFQIYRIFNVGKRDTQIVRITNPYKQWREGRIGLLLTL